MSEDADPDGEVRLPVAELHLIVANMATVIRRRLHFYPGLADMTDEAAEAVIRDAIANALLPYTLRYGPQ